MSVIKGPSQIVSYHGQSLLRWSQGDLTDIFLKPKLRLLTSIAGLLHVNDLNLMTRNFVPLRYTCPVYAIKQWVPKLLYGIYRTDVTWRDQNQGHKVEVIYMDEPCNAYYMSERLTQLKNIPGIL